MVEKARVGIYVQAKYDRPTYKTESYAVRKFAGIELIRDVLERAGIPVTYCSAATVPEMDVVLVSLPSEGDWFQYLGEKLRWPKNTAKTVVGGQGVHNIRGVAFGADVFVFGRGEDIAAPLVAALLAGKRYDNESVAYSENLCFDTGYAIRQSAEPYPHKYIIGNGKEHKEGSIGCQRKCAFCQYTWTLKHVGEEFGDAYTEGAGHAESTIFQMLEKPVEEWSNPGQAMLVGIDGMSERLRRMVNKPITHKMLVRFFLGLTQRSKVSLCRCFMIVGYPTEQREEWKELLDAGREADSQAPDGKPWYPVIHCTPFMAMPCSPVAWWPMSTEAYQRAVVETLRENRRYDSKWRFFEGRRLMLSQTYSTEGVARRVLSSLITRARGKDQPLIRKLSLSRRFWGASVPRKMATLREELDVPRLMGAYEYGELPSEYLRTYIPTEKLWKMGRNLLNKYGDYESWAKRRKVADA